MELLLPTDVVLADNFAPDANSQTACDRHPRRLDGPISARSIKVFQNALADCQP